jgi:hypothetical protein
MYVVITHLSFFHTHIADDNFTAAFVVCLKNGIISSSCKLLVFFKVFYSPTDAQVNCLQNNFKIYIKIDIKTAPTCFDAIIIIRERIIRAC